jgi:hypothetical protein
MRLVITSNHLLFCGIPSTSASVSAFASGLHLRKETFRSKFAMGAADHDDPDGDGDRDDIALTRYRMHLLLSSSGKMRLERVSLELHLESSELGADGMRELAAALARRHRAIALIETKRGGGSAINSDVLGASDLHTMHTATIAARFSASSLHHCFWGGVTIAGRPIGNLRRSGNGGGTDDDEGDRGGGGDGELYIVSDVPMDPSYGGGGDAPMDPTLYGSADDEAAAGGVGAQRFARVCRCLDQLASLKRPADVGGRAPCPLHEAEDIAVDGESSGIGDTRSSPQERGPEPEPEGIGRVESLYLAKNGLGNEGARWVAASICPPHAVADQLAVHARMKAWVRAEARARWELAFVVQIDQLEAKDQLERLTQQYAGHASAENSCPKVSTTGPAQATALPTHSLRRICLEDNGIASLGARAIAAAITSSSSRSGSVGGGSITDVTLDRNAIGDVGLAAIAAALLGVNQIKDVRLAVPPASVLPSTLPTALYSMSSQQPRHTNSMRTLSCAFNSISDGGAITIAQMLALTRTNNNSGGLKDRAATDSYAAGVGGIRDLELDGNVIGPCGFAALGSCLSLRRKYTEEWHMRRLYNEGGKCSDEGDATEFGCSLMRLGLRSNPIGAIDGVSSKSAMASPQQQQAQLVRSAELAVRRAVRLTAIASAYWGTANANASSTCLHALAHTENVNASSNAGPGPPAQRGSVHSIVMAACATTESSCTNDGNASCINRQGVFGHTGAGVPSVSDPSWVLNAIHCRDERPIHDGNPLGPLVEAISTGRVDVVAVSCNPKASLALLPPLPALLLAVLLRAVAAGASAAAEATLVAGAIFAAVGVATVSSGVGRRAAANASGGAGVRERGSRPNGATFTDAPIAPGKEDAVVCAIAAAKVALALGAIVELPHAAAAVAAAVQLAATCAAGAALHAIVTVRSMRSSVAAKGVALGLSVGANASSVSSGSSILAEEKASRKKRERTPGVAMALRVRREVLAVYVGATEDELDSEQREAMERLHEHRKQRHEEEQQVSHRRQQMRQQAWEKQEEQDSGGGTALWRQQEQGGEGEGRGWRGPGEWGDGWSEVEKLEAEKLRLLTREYRRLQETAAAAKELEGDHGADGEEEQQQQQQQQQKAQLLWKNKSAHGTWMRPAPDAGEKLHVLEEDGREPLLTDTAWGAVENVWKRQVRLQLKQLRRYSRGCGVGELIEWFNVTHAKAQGATMTVAELVQTVQDSLDLHWYSDSAGLGSTGVNTAPWLSSESYLSDQRPNYNANYLRTPAQHQNPNLNSNLGFGAVGGSGSAYVSPSALTHLELELPAFTRGVLGIVMSGLTSIDLSFCSIRDAGAVALFTMLGARACASYDTAGLGHHALDHDRHHALPFGNDKCIGGWRLGPRYLPLTHLGLCGNRIGAAGAAALAAALHLNPAGSLTDVRLSRSAGGGIGSANGAGVLALAKALTRNNTLTVLDVGSNKLPAHASSALLVALAGSQTLHALGLAGSGAKGLPIGGCRSDTNSENLNGLLGSTHGATGVDRSGGVGGVVGVRSLGRGWMGRSMEGLVGHARMEATLRSVTFVVTVRFERTYEYAETPEGATTVDDDNELRHRFVLDGVSGANPPLIAGCTYTFDQSHPSNRFAPPSARGAGVNGSQHPSSNRLRFSSCCDGEHKSWPDGATGRLQQGEEYSMGVSFVGTPGRPGACTRIRVTATGIGGLGIHTRRHGETSTGYNRHESTKGEWRPSGSGNTSVSVAAGKIGAKGILKNRPSSAGPSSLVGGGGRGGGSRGAARVMATVMATTPKRLFYYCARQPAMGNPVERPMNVRASNHGSEKGDMGMCFTGHKATAAGGLGAEDTEGAKQLKQRKQLPRQNSELGDRFTPLVGPTATEAAAVLHSGLSAGGHGGARYGAGWAQYGTNDGEGTGGRLFPLGQTHGQPQKPLDRAHRHEAFSRVAAVSRFGKGSRARGGGSGGGSGGSESSSSAVITKNKNRVLSRSGLAAPDKVEEHVQEWTSAHREHLGRDELLTDLRRRWFTPGARPSGTYLELSELMDDLNELLDGLGNDEGAVGPLSRSKHEKETIMLTSFKGFLQPFLPSMLRKFVSEWLGDRAHGSAERTRGWTEDQRATYFQHAARPS